MASIPVAPGGSGSTMKFVMESTPLPPEGSVPPPPRETVGLSKDDKNMGMLTHLLALAGFVIPVVGNVAGPLVLWLVKKDTMPFVDDNGKEAVNFNITVSIATAVCL